MARWLHQDDAAVYDFRLVTLASNFDRCKRLSLLGSPHPSPY